MTHHRRKATEAALATLPLAVREAILRDPLPPEPGAVVVMAAFYRLWERETGRRAAPGEAVFRTVATSEARLGTLLRSLARHAPEVPTYAARPVRAAFYARRAPGPAAPGTGIAPAATSAWPGSRDWPTLWQDLLPALARRPTLRASSLTRYCRSIDRCAAILGATGHPPHFGYFLARTLTTAFSAQGVRAVSRANYLEALIALGKAGGIERPHLDAMRHVAEGERERAASDARQKDRRLATLTEAGGYDAIAEWIGAIQNALAATPQHAARAHRLRAQIALVMVEVNKPARTGDQSRWRLGTDLVRSEAGDWILTWEQEKTLAETSAGPLWPETCLALDALILAGRKPHQAQARYLSLAGCNWLTLSDRAPARALPSRLIKEACGLPSHDFRTLVGDLLRHHTPATAANLLSAHLGHRSQKSIEAYRAAAEGDATARKWQQMRHQIAANGERQGRG